MEKSRISSSMAGDKMERRIQERLDWLADQREKLRTAKAIEQYQNPKRTFFVNLLAIASNFIGLTLGTVLVISAVVYILSFFVSVPLIGGYVSGLLDWVNAFKKVKG
jgi:hypothetical protein